MGKELTRSNIPISDQFDELDPASQVAVNHFINTAVATRGPDGISHIVIDGLRDLKLEMHDSCRKRLNRRDHDYPWDRIDLVQY